MVKMKNQIIRCGRGQMAKSGFTLIELMIVVAIVVIMTAITLGSLNRAQEQQVFNNNFEKLFSLINTARSLAISGKGQLDYTDFDNDGCKDAVTQNCAAPDYVTPGNYGVYFDTSASPNAVLFADINTPASEPISGHKGAYDHGTSHSAGNDLDLDSMSLPSGMTMEMEDSVPQTPTTSGSIFFAPNYADISFSPPALDTVVAPFLILKLKQGDSFCKQIRIHRLAGIPEVEACSVT